MQPSRVFVLFALALLAPSAGAAPVSLYVAPGGNDGADGKTAKTAFATVARARDAVRALRKAGQCPDGATLFVRGGAYHLTETLSFGPEDAGTPEAPLLIRPYFAEKPILRGGAAVAGWEPYKDRILRCDLRKQGLAGVTFDQLFFAGERMTLARVPNEERADPHGGVWSHVVEPAEPGSKRSFRCAPDVHPERWKRPTDGRVCIFPSWDWAWSRVRVAGVKADEARIDLAGNTGYEIRVGDRYFVEGLFEELDAPGEWYLDRENSLLYFWPPAGITTADVVVPRVGNLVAMNGAKHVTLRGFILEDCDGDAVRMEKSDACAVEASTVRNCGAWGVMVEGGSGCHVTGCDITATGRGGIRLGGGDRKTLAPAGHRAENNVIHHVAVFERTYNTAVNVDGVGNTAARNLIYDTPHAGLTVGGNDNVIELNHVHHTNLQSADTGGIYSCPRDWTQRGNVIRWNLWHDCGGFGKRNSWAPVQGGKVAFHYPGFTWGIYMDDPTSGNHIFGNILYRVPVCALHNHGGRDNVWENNVIVDCTALGAGALPPDWIEWPNVVKRFKDVTGPGSPYFERYPAMREYKEEHPEAMTGMKFLRNIVTYTVEGSAWAREHKAYGCEGTTMRLYSLSMREEDFAANEWDSNLIHVAPGLGMDIRLGRSGVNQTLTWDEWRKLGKDRNSQLGDPLFVNAAALDFRLKPNSPALKMGFQPIPVEKIGPYKSDLRVSWPVLQAMGAAGRAQPTERAFTVPGFEPLPAKASAARKGLGNFVAKAAAGGPVKVAYFGGGIHPAGGWRAQVLEGLKKQYPKAAFQTIEASICDCCRGSAFSAWRFAHDVLAQKPDLVLVDFASDDAQSDGQQIARAVEGVVRQAWKADPNVDILFLYAFRDGGEAFYAKGEAPPVVCAYERIAERYGIPSVDMGYTVANLAKQGKMALKGTAGANQDLFSKDGVRPEPAGDRAYAGAILAALEGMKGEGPAVHALARPLASDSWERARQVAITPKMLSGEWKQSALEGPNQPRFARHFDTLTQTTIPGAKLTFRFKGTSAALFNLMGPATGRVRVTVDGKDRGIRQQVDPWSYYYRLAAIPLIDGLPDAEHTVVVELLPDAPDRGVPIAAARKANAYDEKAFEGVAMHLGWIRVMGEVVE